MSEGQPDAGDYPLWLVMQESDLARERINNAVHTDAIVTQAAMAASQHKKAFNPFKKLLELFKNE